MTEQTPTTKPAAQALGQHITSDSGAVFRVEYVQPYRDGDGREQVALVVTPIGTGEPTIWRRFADSPLTLATEDQVADAVDERHRAELAAALHRLAALIVKDRIRVELYAGMSVTVSLPDGEITRVAGLLGVGLGPYGVTAKRAVARIGAGVGSGITLEFLGEPAATPAVVPAEPGGDADKVITEALGEAKAWRDDTTGLVSGGLVTDDARSGE